ncbi:MAG: peptide chain release factor N(5)-glutamine methyltransferase [Burkholderiales bacterium]|nr:peptide chain release factor N(5)-glutamine methyltransferase [Burkholderiales bacterium]
MNVVQAMQHGMALGLERLDAQLLVLHVLGQAAHDRAWLLAHDTDALPPQAASLLEALAARRIAGEPLAYLTGHKEFFGLDLRIDARVLDPRPDTETLVEWALEVLPSTAAARVMDLGTGSGAIALALKATRPHLTVVALDYSTDALAVAQANARRLQLDMQCIQGSWLESVEGRFAAIVSNPPYIRTDDAHLEALAHEPLQALASGQDGLDDIRRIIAQAPKHLEPGGWLLLEHGYDQAPTVCALLEAAGFTKVQSRQDLAGIARCSGGSLPR